MSDDYLTELQVAADADLPLLASCTGGWRVLHDSKIVLDHNGDTCPIHEAEGKAP